MGQRLHTLAHYAHVGVAIEQPQHVARGYTQLCGDAVTDSKADGHSLAVFRAHEPGGVCKAGRRSADLWVRRAEEQERSGATAEAGG